MANAKTPSYPLPRSTYAIHEAVISALRLYFKLEATCWAEQIASKKPDDALYAVLDNGGEVLSFADYRAGLTAKEKLLKDETPPSIWRRIQKELKDSGELSPEE